MKDWPKSQEWYGVSLYEQPEYWEDYLSEPEGEINTKYKIFPEPSVQAGMGAVFIYDESEEERFEDLIVDFQEWCEKEIEMAASSNSSDEYKERYEQYILSLIGG